ncbi:hypothetical protein LINPERHAP1_LOCUS24472 [Linum perenne]
MLMMICLHVYDYFHVIKVMVVCVPVMLIVMTKCACYDYVLMIKLV